MHTIKIIRYLVIAKTGVTRCHTVLTGTGYFQNATFCWNQAFLGGLDFLTKLITYKTLPIIN